MSDPKERTISCADLYKFAHGYDVDGGLYDTFQRAMAAVGWCYNVTTDAWSPPHGDLNEKRYVRATGPEWPWENVCAAWPSHVEATE